MPAQDVTLDFNQLFKLLPDAYMVIAHNGAHFTVIDASDVYTKVTHTSQEKLLGRTLDDELCEELGIHAEEMLASLRRTSDEQVLQEMAVIHTQTGTRKVCYWKPTNYPVPDSNYIIHTLHDVSDLVTTERALADNEDKLRFMADSMPQLVWITLPDGYHEYYNQQWYDYTGTTPGATDGEGWNDLFHPDDRQRAKASWSNSLKTGEPYDIEYRLYHAPSKSYRWVIGRALPFKDSNGTIAKWYGTCTDIDEQKRTTQIQAFLAKASKELASSLRYTQTLENVTKLCVPEIADWCTVDFYDEQTGWEQVALAHVDPKKIDLVKKYREINPINIDDPTGVPAVIRSGKPEFYPVITDEIVEASVGDPENKAFIKSLHLRSIIIAPISVQKKVVGAISFVSSDSERLYTQSDYIMAIELASRISLTMTNATLYKDSREENKQRRQLEEELVIANEQLEARVQKRTKQLQQLNDGLEAEILKRQEVELELKANSEDLARSNQELQDFAYVASHDLQEPLRKIQAFGDILESEYATKIGDGMEYLTRMRAAASRMSVLIEDLLSFSRVTTKTQPSVEVNLNTLVTDVISDLDDRINRTQGEVKVGQLPTVWADPTHMRQLLQNLIGNALKFHRENVPPVVTVESKEVQKGDEMYEITVTDNGIGFEEKYLDRIFSVFQRLHGRGTYEGTGIGLAVCRKIAERYGGTITASSTKNSGSTFIFKIPIKAKGVEDDNDTE